jgi:DNA polymerase I
VSKFLEFIISKCPGGIKVLDTEYQPDITNTFAKETLCYVYQDIVSGEVNRFWEFKNQRYGQPHFDLEDTLIVSHYALAEAGSFISDLMPVPVNVWDTWVEAKNLYNGARSGFSLLEVAREYNINATMTDEEKEIERSLILDSSEFDLDAQKRVLDYCEKDVATTAKIFKCQVADYEKRFNLKTEEDFEIRFNQICMRGAAMVDFAKINAAGIPVNYNQLMKFKEAWPKAKSYLIKKYNKEIDCFENETFKAEKFEELLKNIDPKIYAAWPRTFTGKLSLTEQTFKKFTHVPEIEKVFEIKRMLSQTTLGGYSIGENGRSITNLRPFSTSSYRCAPGGSTFPFNASGWARTFITPPPGSYLAYIDYSSQEPAIQGYLSGDQNLIDAYKSGDIYIHTAKLAGAVPADATKITHPKEREQWKVIVLATSYGMGAKSIAEKLGVYTDEAAALLNKFKKIYSVFFEYIDNRMNTLHRDLKIETVFGCARHLSKHKRTTNNSWRNFPIQANGAEILRCAIHKLHKNNIKIIATIHDALLIEVPIPEHKQLIQLAQNLMTEAAIDVVGGRIETDVNLITEKGFIQEKEKHKRMFNELMAVVEMITQPDSETRAAV